MNNIIKSLLGFSLGVVLLTGGVAFAGDSDYGAIGALENENWSIEAMLEYAIQDEYLARAEYEKIMAVYGEQRPFSNIMKAEETHIDLLIPLFATYEIDLPEDTANEHVVLPASVEEALNVGIQAEIDNIAMYEGFLKQDLPDDITNVFERLKSASESHLKAFERGVARGNGTTGWKARQRRG